jgi:protein gp37
MSNKTKIQWCHSTVNPIMGCGGCELFPSRNAVLHAIDNALVEAGVPKRVARSKPLFKELVSRAYSKIKSPTRHHKQGVTTTNIWHLRKEFINVILARHGVAAAEAVELAIGRSITCYAAKLHLNKGYSLLPKSDGTPRQPKAGYAPTFEEITSYEGRVWKTAATPDLLGTEDPERPWISGLPRLVFVSDMGDALSRKSDFPFLKREVIAPIQSEEGLRHLWLWLTKRPARMAELADEIGGFPENVCAMTTVTGPDTLYRIDELRTVNAKVRGLSIEPLWERIPPKKLNLKGIDWVIVGGESGALKTVRPFPTEWAEELRDYCAKQGVAFFLKQLGRKPTREGETLKLKDTHGGDWEEWDPALRVREFPHYFHDYRSQKHPAYPRDRRVREKTSTPESRMR